MGSQARAKGVIPIVGDAPDRPGGRVVFVHDGRGRVKACAVGRIIKLPLWARSERVILHELAHVIQTERPGHGRQFCRIFLDIVRRWHSDRDAWRTLRASFRAHRVRYTRRRKGGPGNPNFRALVAAAAREKGGGR